MPTGKDDYDDGMRRLVYILLLMAAIFAAIFAALSKTVLYDVRGRYCEALAESMNLPSAEMCRRDNTEEER